MTPESPLMHAHFAPTNVRQEFSEMPTVCDAIASAREEITTDLETLWRNGREAWKDVPSATEWVDELRGNVREQQIGER